MLRSVALNAAKALRQGGLLGSEASGKLSQVSAAHDQEKGIARLLRVVKTEAFRHRYLISILFVSPAPSA
jgi:hypothetical protein